MQKIVIKNFGAIEYAEIEIKKVLVLIGEQASGKSTIAKLIYFFKNLNDKNDFYDFIPENIQTIYDDINSDFANSTTNKFCEYFGSPKNLSSFEVTFYYNFLKEKYLRLYLDKSKNIKLEYSNNFFDKEIKSDLKSYINQMNEYFQNNLSSKQIVNYEIYGRRYIRPFNKAMNMLFENNQANSLFIIASRNCTVSYSDLFEKYLYDFVNSRIRKNQENKLRNLLIADEVLMLNFIKETTNTNNIFLATGNGFESFLEECDSSDMNLREKLNKVIQKINVILKGKYVIDNQGEKIILNSDDRQYLYLQNSSSGQQESIRILQDIFLNIFQDLAVLRVIEEPEAHLFPIAQKHLVELLAMMVNHNDNNQLIITTHSPYILSVFNNLLFAQRVVDKNPSAKSEVSEIIPENYWLNADEFSAYSLGNQSLEEEANYCESILDSNTGMIAQNYLDTVSEMLGGDFNELYRLHARTFKRK